MTDQSDADLAAELEAADRTYFAFQQDKSNAEFWRRMAGKADLSGKSVIEVGCGLGALSFDAARHGASSVLGIDIDQRSLRFAQLMLDERYADLKDRVRFEERALETINEQFDYVISKDAFEHMEDLPAMLTGIARVLKPDGKLIAGFGPLYFSPFGDHGRYLGRRPWLPVTLPEPVLFWLARRYRKLDIRRPIDVGLNKLTPRQFRDLIRRQGWQVESMVYNAGGKRGLKAMNALRRLPGLERYFTVSIYTVLRKPPSS